jgi:hypothetical protein
VHYDISLFNLELGGAWTYHGIVKIDLKVISPTGELVLNSEEIEVKSAEISDPKGLCHSNANSERITSGQTTGSLLTRIFTRHPLVEGVEYFLRQELGTSGLSVPGRDHACGPDPYGFFHWNDE